jgi:tellurite resistance protein
MTIEPRPKRYPPPEFPPRRAKLFARTPPAVFPPILGLMGLVLALRLAADLLWLPQAPVDLVAAVAVALWAFAAVAYGTKLARRPAVLWEDLKVLPGRAGLAAGTVGMLAMAPVVMVYAPDAARFVLFAGLALHAALALAVARVLMAQPLGMQTVSPVWHLSFVGFIVGGLSAVPLGHEALAWVLFLATVPVAVAIWAISLVQLARQVPPAPLRPLLAIHLAPVALFSLVAGALGMPEASLVLAVVGLLGLLGLLAAGRWIMAAGFSPLWGAFGFPMVAVASALLAWNDWIAWAGCGVLLLTMGLVPYVLWRVLKMWAAGSLAEKTNAAEA